jgi:hypothetical protein
MKLPGVNKDAILDYLLRHGEKFVVTLVGIGALYLAWCGIDAVRSKSVSADQQPEAILRVSAEAAAHVEREKNPPATEKRNHGSLTAAIDTWRNPSVAPAPPLAMFDRPLFQEFAKRTQPDVFPLEDLRAVAGLAVLPLKEEPAAAGRAVEPEPAAKPRPPRGQRPGNPADGGVFGPAGGAAPTEIGGSKGRITPYVIVTGLIPVAKQVAEYRRRFEGVGYKDQKRDFPLWADYVIERSEVAPTGGERWQKIDLAAAGRKSLADGTKPSSADVRPEFLLPLVPKFTPEYCWPLPQLAEGSWGLDALHPWVVRQMRTAAKAGPSNGEQGLPQPDPNNVFPGDQPPRPATATGSQDLNPLEYRQFRFIDTAVEFGKSYRYRVRFELWNPNVGVAAQHVTDPAVAKPQKLAAPDSNATAAVTVPDPTAILVGTKRKADMKRYKRDTLEILVLGPSELAGSYSLRGLVTEAGGIANVSDKLNRPGDQRTRGEEIETNRVLVDVRGRQEDRSDLKSPKPPEPFELLYLRSDGSFEFVSAADSEARIGQYESTLPASDDGKGVPRPGQPETNPNPFGIFPGK